MFWFRRLPQGKTLLVRRAYPIGMLDGHGAMSRTALQRRGHPIKRHDFAIGSRTKAIVAPDVNHRNQIELPPAYW